MQASGQDQGRRARSAHSSLPLVRGKLRRPHHSRLWPCPFVSLLWVVHRHALFWSVSKATNPNPHGAVFKEKDVEKAEICTVPGPHRRRQRQRTSKKKKESTQATGAQIPTPATRRVRLFLFFFYAGMLAAATTIIAIDSKSTDAVKDATADDLPDELLVQIMGHLPCMVRRYGSVAVVSHRWRTVALDETAYARTACCHGRDMADPYASAVELFHVDCIEYALDLRHAQTADACSKAAAHGRLDLAARFSERGAMCNSLDMAVAAAAGGHLDVLKTLCETSVPKGDTQVCTAAAAGGHLPCLKYAHEAWFAWDAMTSAHAAARGHIECLVYLCQHGCPRDDEATTAALDPSQFGVRQTESDAGARDNLDRRLECLRYLVLNGCPWDDDRAFDQAAAAGSKWLALALDLGCPFDIDDNVGYDVISSGDIESVALLAARGYEWGWDEMVDAVQYGDPEMIDALLAAGAPWDAGMATMLASHGNPDLMQWVIDRGLAWDVEKCMLKAIGARGDALYRWFIESGHECPRLAKFCLHAVNQRCHEALEWLLAHNFPWDPVADTNIIIRGGGHCMAVLARASLIGAGPCEESAAMCNLAAGHDYKHDGGATIRTLYALGHRGDARATSSAASAGNITTLQWLIGQGCPVDHATVTSAAGGGHVDCLRHLCEMGHACDADVYAAAIRSGSVACLAYLDQIHCPRPDRVTLLAAQDGRIDCLRHLHESGVPLHPDTCRYAVRGGSVACLRYAYKRGCPLVVDTYVDAINKSCWDGRIECDRYLAAQRDVVRAPPNL
ncbi:Ankyrin repeat domain containing protein [Pandoravirus salinus]|uniref:Ankyrin repeat domain containing protein n=1 Tax=Pandoravirus salinus TaxID=1349410 RepID=S4VVS1_9VIRU|nr:ankyrin repeat domain [Pandoravirus salinus]AGO83501.1 Ankyrin repeat domain containing protein [Pandoravirus salinus]